jgi:hypothetical protein
MATDNMTVKINPNDTGNPVGKLADAELHFIGGPLEGLKLIEFGTAAQERVRDVVLEAYAEYDRRIASA